MSKEPKAALPPIKWDQTVKVVIFVIELEGIEYPLIKIERDQVYFKGVGGKEKKLYGLSLQLHKDISPEISRWRINNQCIFFILIKAEEGYWSWLTKEEVIYPFFKNDFDKWKEEDEATFVNREELFMPPGFKELCETLEEDIKGNRFTQKELQPELEEIKRELYEKDKKLQAVQKGMVEKDNKLQALEENLLDKDKRLQNIEEILKNIQGVKTVVKLEENIADTYKETRDAEILTQKYEESMDEKDKKIQILENEKEKAHKEIQQLKDALKVLEVKRKPAIMVSGDSRRLVHADNPTVFKIIVKDHDILTENISALVITPSGKEFNAEIFPSNSSNAYGLKFTPFEVGSHTIKVSAREQVALVLMAEVYNTKLIKVQKPSHGTVGHPVKFEVDVSQAGEGELELSVELGLFRIPHTSSLQNLNGNKYEASFVPSVQGEYIISLKFNGKLLKHFSDFTFYAYKSVKVKVHHPKPELIPVNETVNITVELMELNVPMILEQTVTGPTGEISSTIIRIHPARFLIIFTPIKAGTYQISIKVNGETVPETPLELKACHNYHRGIENATLFIAKSFYSKNQNKLSNLKKIPVNQVSTFVIEFEGLEEGDGNIKLHVTIEGPNGKVPLKLSGYKSGFIVEFTPDVVGNYKIEVFYNDQAVKGTPFTAKAIDDYENPMKEKKMKTKKFL